MGRFAGYAKGLVELEEARIASPERIFESLRN